MTLTSSRRKSQLRLTPIRCLGKTIEYTEIKRPDQLFKNEILILSLSQQRFKCNDLGRVVYVEYINQPQTDTALQAIVQSVFHHCLGK